MRKRRWLIVLFLVIGLLAWRLHTWGITTYFIGIASNKGLESEKKNRTTDIEITSDQHIGAALILHGLNFEAEGMRPLGQMLNTLGLNVKIARLYAHRDQPQEMTGAIRSEWVSQISTLNRTLSRPRLCVGYSMGALLAAEQHLHGSLECDGLLFFSPAFALRTPDWIIRLSRTIIPAQIMFPSAIPQPYRHFDTIHLGPTFAFFDTLVSFRAARTERPTPGLIIIDDRDEVIDAKESVRMAKSIFPKIEVIRIKAWDLNERHANHILIDEKHVGPKQWTDIVQRVRELTTRLTQGSIGPSKPDNPGN
jgi:esterase/lipase